MEGSITFISDRTMQLFGHSSDTEILGNNILKWVAPEDHAKAIENLRALIEKNYVKDAEYRLVKHNGTQFWGEINSAVIRGTDGSSKGMIFVTRDVTERKHGENLLRLSEQRYKLLAESSLTGVYLIQNNVFRYVNPSFAEIFGYEVAEIINILGPMDLTSPEHRSLVDQQIQKRLYGTENDIRYTFKGFRKNKTEVDVEVHGGKTIFEGEPAILGTLLDITDRKQIENQLRNLSRAVEQSPVSIIITDPAGNIEYVNPKFIQVSGYTFEEVLGKNPRFLKSDHTPAQEYKQLWETISAGGEWRGEFHNKKKNGELYWESVLISGIRDNDKNISHFLAVKEDITEKKLLEAQMLRAQRMESIGTLAGGIAHDLNNVLAPILMAIEILRKQVTTDAGQKILKTLETSAERGKNIIRQVLTFARGIDGERTPLQPKYLMKEIEQIIKETFPKMIEIQLEIQNGLYDINGDLTQLHQVLMNLCVNARDAMPYGGKLFLRAENVTIDECYAKLRNQNTSGLFVLLSISDTGTGIPANILNKIFDPFFTTKEIGKGTGLGLSTVHTIVKNHGGFVDVHSEEGKGTMFKVYLPATESTMNAQQQKEIDILQQGRGEIILIVDDELAIREITKQTLESNGYNAYTAADGTEALVLYSKIGSRINVVVTDIMMPFLDGWSTIRALRMLNPDIKIIAMSGLEVKEQMSGAIGKEILGFLSKPFNAKNLLTAINDVLRHPPVFHLER
jgi:PAS domain S-box-containing protein